MPQPEYLIFLTRNTEIPALWNTSRIPLNRTAAPSALNLHMRSKRFYFKKLLLNTIVLIVACIFPVSFSGAAEVKIAALLSNSGQPYTENLAGFKQYLEKKDMHVDLKLYNLDGDPGKASQAVQDIKKNRPALIFCLGGLATEHASGEISDLPIISTMVLRTGELKKSNMTGIPLDFSAETHFNWMHRILPKVKTVGVVYNPKENKKRSRQPPRLLKSSG